VALTTAFNLSVDYSTQTMIRQACAGPLTVFQSVE
jgi:hypothetical protein